MEEHQIQAWRIERLAAMVEREGGKAAAGRKLGYKDGAFVGQMLRGERPITEKTVLAVHALSGYAGWFNEGAGELATLPVAALTPSPAPGVPVVHVPLLANAGSMGPGTDIQHDDILVGQIALSEQWVSRRLQPTHLNALRFIHAYGDSMSPTFEDGDILLVDTGIKDPRVIDGVYVMAANDRLYIKRVRQRMDKALEISSDNPTVKTVDVLNGDHVIDILGRVIWAWNGRKL
jgi:phage repressor protein C with HTH and peptisase S24 domain